MNKDNFSPTSEISDFSDSQSFSSSPSFFNGGKNKHINYSPNSEIVDSLNSETSVNSLSLSSFFNGGDKFSPSSEISDSSNSVSSISLSSFFNGGNKNRNRIRNMSHKNNNNLAPWILLLVLIIWILITEIFDFAIIRQIIREIKGENKK